jgi:hypothetical protein
VPRIDEIIEPGILAGVGNDMAHCAVPVRHDLAHAHALVLTRLALPGTWWTGAERVAIASAARSARHCAFCAERKTALSPYNISGTHDIDPAIGITLLPEMINIVHLVINDATRMTAAAINRLSDVGVSDAHFVEALGIATSIRSMDQICRGLGVPVHSLPSPVDGEPSRIRPDVLAVDEAFLPMMAKHQPKPPNDDLWGDDWGNSGNLIRAMGLVPDAIRDMQVMSQAQYLEAENVFDMTAGRNLAREQIEFIASRVSGINGCFY